MVGGMIRRSVRSRLRNLYWSAPQEPLTAPVIFYCNHHGWLDGYILFHVVERLKLKALDWIEEFDAFPLFAKAGGMRYAAGDTTGRATTIRKTIRLMNAEKRSLMLFAEGVLHRPPAIWPLGKALQLVAEKVKGVTLVPTAIYYEHSIHERPEAWVSLGSAHSFSSLEDCHSRLEAELNDLKARVAKDDSFPILVKGTGDVNERMSMKRFARK
jgi:1-acyl-sn-glycerol-3-phosphate acyltransferase